MNHKKTTLSPDTLYKTIDLSDTAPTVWRYKTDNPPFNSYVNYANVNKIINTGDRTLKSYLMEITTPYMAEHPLIFHFGNLFDCGHKI